MFQTLTGGACMQFSEATLSDAVGMSRVLEEIIEATGHMRPHSTEFVASNYIRHPSNVLCSVALDDNSRVLGFQSLIRATEGNKYRVPTGWGIIGTHVSPRVHRSGVGTGLFQMSLAASRLEGIKVIDACITSDNPGGLRYYDAMGFKTYRELQGAVQKQFVDRG